MNKSMKIVILTILAIIFLFSSIIATMYSPVYNVDEHGMLMPLTERETQIYNCSLYVMIISGFTTMMAWMDYMITKNPNQ